MYLMQSLIICAVVGISPNEYLAGGAVGVDGESSFNRPLASLASVP
jgi:hypothetical protein